MGGVVWNCVSDDLCIIWRDGLRWGISKFVANVAKVEACPVYVDVFAKGDDFEEFSHLVLVGQFLYGSADTEVVCRTWRRGLCQQVGNA